MDARLRREQDALAGWGCQPALRWERGGGQTILGAEQQDLGHRQRFRMCNGQERALRSERARSLGGGAVQLELRRPASPDDFDIPR